MTQTKKLPYIKTDSERGRKSTVQVLLVKGADINSCDTKKLLYINPVNEDLEALYILYYKKEQILTFVTIRNKLLYISPVIGDMIALCNL